MWARRAGGRAKAARSSGGRGGLAGAGVGGFAVAARGAGLRPQPAIPQTRRSVKAAVRIIDEGRCSRFENGLVGLPGVGGGCAQGWWNVSETPIYQDRQTGRVYRDAPEMVNDYLRRFGETVGVTLDPLDDDGYAEVRRGSATVGVNVLEEHGILLFLSRIMDVPREDRETFYRRLLELNFLVTSDGAFSVDKDRDAVYLRALRRLSGLDYEEFEDLLHTTATVADEWDDRLAELFPRDGHS